MKNANRANQIAADYDLHSHTTASDGSLAPTQLVHKAVEQGVKCLAISDHDCVAGLSEAQTEAVTLAQLQLINAIELSCRWQKLDIHIVGLGIDPDSLELNACIHGQQAKRLERAQRIGNKLAAKGYPGAYEAALTLAQSAEQIGRPHFAQFLVTAGAVNSPAQAFKKFLGQGKPAYVATDWMEIGEAVAVIHQAGGLAVLAHPDGYGMTNTKLRRLLTDFSAAKGDGLEVAASNQAFQKTAWLGQLAQEFELYASQGSDFHGSKMPWAQLGRIAPLPKQCKPIWQSPDWPQGGVA